MKHSSSIVTPSHTNVCELTLQRAPTDAFADLRWPSGHFDPLDQALPVRVIPVRDAPGVQPQALDGLIGGMWTVSPVGDRTGLRLLGQGSC